MAKNPTKVQEKSLKLEEAKTKAIEKQITAYEKMLDNGIRLTKEQRKHLRTLKLTADKVSSTSDVYKDISKDMSGMIKKEHTLKFSIKDRFGMGRGLAKLGVQQLQVMRERVAAGEVGNDLAEDLLDTTKKLVDGEMGLKDAKSKVKQLSDTLRKGYLKEDGTRRKLKQHEIESIKNEKKLPQA